MTKGKQGLSPSSLALKNDLTEQAKSLIGVDKVLVNNLIEKLCSVNEFTDELSDMVRNDGVMVEKEVGTVNNRHTELVENPALTAYSKNVGRLGDLLKKVSAFADKAPIVEEADDGFDAFNAQ